MTQSIFEMLRNAVVQYGYWAVGGALLLENAGIPVPGETILLLASFLAYSEHDFGCPGSSWWRRSPRQLGTIWIRAWVLRWTSAATPLSAIFRIKDATISRGEELFAKYGAADGVFCAFCFRHADHRGTHGRRAADVMEKVSGFQFSRRSGLGQCDFRAGYLFGRHWDRLEEGLNRFNVVALIIVLVIAGTWWWRNRKNGKAAAGR